MAGNAIVPLCLLRHVGHHHCIHFGAAYPIGTQGFRNLWLSPSLTRYQVLNLNVASKNPLASSDKGTKEPVSSLSSSSLTSLSSFLSLFDGGGSCPSTMTLSCVPGCELLLLCAASRFSVFKSACIALTHLKRSVMASAVDFSPLLLSGELMVLHTQPRCHSQENSQ